MAKPKKFTLAAADKLYAAYNEQKEVHFGEYTILADVKFKRSKLNQMFFEYTTRVQELRDAGELEEGEITSEFYLLHYILILKYFTNIPIGVNLTTPQLLALLNQFIDIGLIETMFNDGFDSDQLVSLNGQFEQLAARAKTIEEQMNTLLIPTNEKVAAAHGEI